MYNLLAVKDKLNPRQNEKNGLTAVVGPFFMKISRHRQHGDRIINEAKTSFMSPEVVL